MSKMFSPCGCKIKHNIMVGTELRLGLISSVLPSDVAPKHRGLLQNVIDEIKVQ